MNVSNSSTSGIRDAELQICGGSLTASVVVPGKVDLAAIATHDTSSHHYDEVVHDGTVQVGDSVVIEANCYDADGSEVGYARVEGHVIMPPYSKYGGNTYVTPAVLPGKERMEGCLQTVEIRGAAPCISELMVAPK